MDLTGRVLAMHDVHDLNVFYTFNQGEPDA
jgi:hypothetical protein